MAINNEQAMQQLEGIKAKADAHSDPVVSAYYRGIHLGLAEGYWTAGVITCEQYMQTIEPMRLAA